MVDPIVLGYLLTERERVNSWCRELNECFAILYREKGGWSVKLDMQNDIECGFLTYEEIERAQRNDNIR